MKYLEQQPKLARLNELLETLWRLNPFYTEKWRRAGLEPALMGGLEQLKSYPFTERTELLADQRALPPLGRNLTFASHHYKRFHSSSGTTRAPLFWADTLPGWRWLLTLSEQLYWMAEVRSEDRIFFAIPPGRSLGPVVLLEGAIQMGSAVFRATTADLEEQAAWLAVVQPTVLVGRPRLLESLAHLRLRESPRRLILTAPASSGERASVESKWGAPAFDRYGLTEAGSVAGECPSHSGGMHLLDDEFVIESIDPVTGLDAADGAPGELVLTGLGRMGRPIVRYRTGDQVRLVRNFECPCGRTGPFLSGGVQRLIGTPHAGVTVTPESKYRSTSAAV